jgi:cytoskeletal protein CcmA (bactofilin family)
MKKARLCAFILFAAMLIMLLPPAAQALDGANTFYIDYDITVDTTWSAGTYYICITAENQSPAIKPGATLTIESGSTVYFSSAANVMVNDGANRMANCLTVNGTLIADGLTFKALTGYEDERSWSGIQLLAAENGETARVTLTGCTFQHAEFPVEVKENAALGDDQSVNVTATNCVFSDPHYLNATGVYYHTVGSGTVSLTGCTFNDYYYGVWVGHNNRADIDINVRGCTFNGTLKQPIRIQGGQSAVVEDCIFNDITGGMEGVVSIFTEYNETSDAVQTVTLTGNTFSGDASTDRYPAVVGARCQINADVQTDAVTFTGDTYPTAYRYIKLDGNVGSSSTTNKKVERAVWGITDIPYLVEGVKVFGKKDEINGYSTLIIKPGVTVCLGNPGAELLITGALTAEGTPEKHITFYLKDGAEWANGIAAGGDLEGNISLKYCDITGLNNGIRINAPGTAADSAITIENCVIMSAAYPTELKGKNVTVRNTSFTGPGVNIGRG